MSFLADVAALINDEGIADLGVDLFYGKLRDNPDEVVVIFEYAGQARSDLAENRFPGLQVITRGESEQGGYDAAREKIESIYNYLVTIGNETKEGNALAAGVTINNTTYLKFSAIQEPFPLGRDEKDRPQFAVNFLVQFYGG